MSEMIINRTNSEILPEIQLGFEDNQERSKEFREMPTNPKWGSSYVEQNCESYLCKLCGRGFKSPRAVFGHLRCHSKRNSEIVSEEAKRVNIPRKKRSVGRYKTHTSSSNNSSWSIMNASSSSFTNVVDDEMQDIVASLLFLANGGPWSCNSVDHVSDEDDSVKDKVGPKIAIESDVEGPKQFSKFDVSMGGCDSFEAKIGKFHGSNCGSSNFECAPVSYIEFLPEFCEAEIKNRDVGVPSADTSFSNLIPCNSSVPSATETQYESVDQVFDRSASKICGLPLVIEQYNIETDEVELNESEIEFGSKSCGLLIEERKNESIDVTDQLCNSGRSAPTIANTCIDESQKCTCSLCNKSFPTHQALGGHCLHCQKKKRNYKCMVCNRTFPSGQALGGHKRAHFKTTVQSISSDKESMVAVTEESSH